MAHSYARAWAIRPVMAGLMEGAGLDWRRSIRLQCEDRLQSARDLSKRGNTTMDMSLIGGAASALKAAMDITKAMKELRDWELLSTKIWELNGVIMDAQTRVFAVNEERSALIETVAKLEKQITQFKNWETQKKRYSLTEAAPGVFAYINKEDAKKPEPPHYICTNCYEDCKKSILHLSNLPGSRRMMLSCNGCNAKLVIEHSYKPPAYPEST